MDKKEIGRMGEDIASRFLVKQGYKILERNFLRKYGEIDVVALKGDITHFIEVKTVSREAVNHETGDYWRPEENVHPYKLARLRRVIQVYLINRQIRGDWQFDVITVYYNPNTREARVDFLENLIL